MNYKAEHHGRPVAIDLTTHVALEMCFGGFVRPIHIGETIAVCSWCEYSSLISAILTNRGYVITHGVCKKCSEKILTENQATKGQENERKTNT